MVAKPLTPLELVSSSIHIRSLAVMIISAGGKNSDIISAFENVVSREPRSCIALCLCKASPLSRAAKLYRFVDLPDLTPPIPRDGFLATNSLLAFSVLLVRAYARAFSSEEILPREFELLLPPNRIQELRASSDPLWKRETLVVLYGPSVSAAVLDLESKFSEAALGNVQLADFRNFAHGRHHWLDKRGAKTGVLALFANDEQDMAEKTLRLIPASIPATKICLPNVGVIASLAAIVAVLHLVAAAAQNRGIDPGRPGVAHFGRRIYRLQALRGRRGETASGGMVPIARKLGCEVTTLGERVDLTFWQGSYQRFIKELVEAPFAAVLFDYDGTLCDARDRFVGLRQEVTRQLMRILKKGILVGIATGRGKSTREDLRKVLPKGLWKNIYIGYYNGADIAALSDNGSPDSSPRPSNQLALVADIIAKHPIISRAATCEIRRAQVSVQPRLVGLTEVIWKILQPITQAHDMKAVRSSHSIDIIPLATSKRALLKHLKGKITEGNHVLLIGDKGQWPGNDYDLLSESYSLSVDEVSADPDTCWNLAPPGYRGVQATLAYLNAIEISLRKFRFAPHILSSQGFLGRSHV
jgi:hypothetical protein